MVQPVGNPDKKWDAIVQNITELCGSAPQLIDELYKSETATNFNNRSIAWLLKNYNRIYDDPDMSLDLYTVSVRWESQLPNCLSAEQRLPTTA